MTRFVSIWIGLWAVALSGGCAGELNDPGAFTGENPPDTKSAETILAESCGTTGCHDDSSQAQGGLDLLSPGVRSRLVGVNSTATGCTDRVLVVDGDPNNSYLLDKVLNVPGICGLQMPIVGMLDQDEIDVLQAWILDPTSVSDPSPSPEDPSPVPDEMPSATKDAETILAESCGFAGCHDDSAQASAGLDLVSPDVASRLLAVNSSAPMCTDRTLVVGGDPDNSYLLNKVENTNGICGNPMPLGIMLDVEEVDVLRQWIVDLGGS
jgi:hypothetical protein